MKINENLCVTNVFWQMLCHYSQGETYLKYQVKCAQPHSHY